MSGLRQSITLTVLSGIAGLALLSGGLGACAVDSDPIDENVDIDEDVDEVEAAANPGRGTGRAAWNVTNRDGSRFTVVAEINNGVARDIIVTGTLAPFAELPRTVTNADGAVLRISRGSGSARRHYEGNFRALIDNSQAYSCTKCACVSDKCIVWGTNTNCFPAGISCYQVPCLGGGGGVEPLDVGFTATIPPAL
jgi:hypothetical protein